MTESALRAIFRSLSQDELVLLVVALVAIVLAIAAAATLVHARLTRGRYHRKVDYSPGYIQGPLEEPKPVTLEVRVIRPSEPNSPSTQRKKPGLTARVAKPSNDDLESPAR
jgi:hypothetical protein